MPTAKLPGKPCYFKFFVIAWQLARFLRAASVKKQPFRKSYMSDVMNLLGRKGGAQGIEHGQHVDDFLHDGTAYRA